MCTSRQRVNLCQEGKTIPQLPRKISLFIIIIIQEGSGFIAVNTNKLIVYGSYSSAMNPSICVEAVEGVGMY